MARYLLSTAALALAVSAYPALAQEDSSMGSEDSSSMSAEAATVTIAEGGEYGQHLADGDGRALYLFTTDKPEAGGEAEISCTSQKCLTVWPLFTTNGEPSAGDNVEQSMLGTMDYEGQTVVTYNGWPLYHFSKDQGADSPQGQDVEAFGGEWYLVSPEGTELEGEG